MADEYVHQQPAVFFQRLSQGNAGHLTLLLIYGVVLGKTYKLLSFWYSYDFIHLDGKVPAGYF